MTVTVAMPYFAARPWVEQAVRSVLAQTYRDLRLIVVGDGDTPPLSGIRDRRMTVYVLPENRGTYFALQLALLASPDEWHAPHGADDWTDPAHLEALLAIGETAVAMGQCWIHDGDTATVQSIGREGWHTGLFLRDRLWALGGYDPSARLSQDTHVLKLLDQAGGYTRTWMADPTYHIRRRPGSLTTAPETGMTSRLRRAQRHHDHRIRNAVAGKSDEFTRAYRAGQVPAAVMTELNAHVRMLRGIL